MAEEQKTEKETVALMEEQAWFNKFIEDTQGIVLEIKNLSWSVVETYHKLGKHIVDYKPTFVEKGYTVKEMLGILSEQVGRSDKTLYRATQFYEKYPDLSLSPYTEDVQWIQIVKDLSKKQLPEGEKKTEEPSNTSEGEGENAPAEPQTLRPEIKLTYDRNTKLYVLDINPDDFIKIDFSKVKNDLSDYLKGLGA